MLPVTLGLEDAERELEGECEAEVVTEGDRVGDMEVDTDRVKEGMGDSVGVTLGVLDWVAMRDRVLQVDPLLTREALLDTVPLLDKEGDREVEAERLGEAVWEGETEGEEVVEGEGEARAVRVGEVLVVRLPDTKDSGVRVTELQVEELAVREVVGNDCKVMDPDDEGGWLSEGLPLLSWVVRRDIDTLVVREGEGEGVKERREEVEGEEVADALLDSGDPLLF